MKACWSSLPFPVTSGNGELNPLPDNFYILLTLMDCAWANRMRLYGNGGTKTTSQARSFVKYNGLISIKASEKMGRCTFNRAVIYLKRMCGGFAYIFCLYLFFIIIYLYFLLCFPAYVSVKKWE